MSETGYLAVDRTGVPRNPYRVAGFQTFHRLRLLLYTRSQDREFRRTMLAAGTIRRFEEPTPEATTGQPPFSFTTNQFDGSARGKGLRGSVSNPLRYLISTVYVNTGGNQRSMPMLRPAIPPTVSAPNPPLVLAGNVQARPTLRQRVPSFGSRIPALNNYQPGDVEG